VAILSKGSVDLGACSVTGDVEAKDNEHVVAWCAVNEGGSPRRCGGQGDVLAGTLATFLAWASIAKSQVSATPRDDTRHKAKDSKTSLSAAEKVSAAAHAALVTRGAAGLAFGKKQTRDDGVGRRRISRRRVRETFPRPPRVVRLGGGEAEETETETAL
jgi:hypothetical protein